MASQTLLSGQMLLSDFVGQRVGESGFPTCKLCSPAILYSDLVSSHEGTVACGSAFAIHGSCCMQCAQPFNRLHVSLELGS